MSSTASNSASSLDLPAEIVKLVCAQSRTTALKQVRLGCRAFHAHATEPLFKKVWITAARESVASLQWIVRSSRLSIHLQAVVLYQFTSLVATRPGPTGQMLHLLHGRELTLLDNGPAVAAAASSIMMSMMDIKRLRLLATMDTNTTSRIPLLNVQQIQIIGHGDPFHQGAYQTLNEHAIMGAARNPGRQLQALYILPFSYGLQMPLQPFNVTVQPFLKAPPILVLQSIQELVRQAEAVLFDMVSARKWWNLGGTCLHPDVVRDILSHGAHLQRLHLGLPTWHVATQDDIFAIVFHELTFTSLKSLVLNVHLSWQSLKEFLEKHESSLKNVTLGPLCFLGPIEDNTIANMLRELPFVLRKEQPTRFSFEYKYLAGDGRLAGTLAPTPPFSGDIDPTTGVATYDWVDLISDEQFRDSYMMYFNGTSSFHGSSWSAWEPILHPVLWFNTWKREVDW